MARLSLKEIAAAVRGEAIAGPNPPEGGTLHEVGSYSIDSRTVGEGALFFAIVGPRLDGHDFVTEAFRKGAAAAVVARPPGRFPGVPLLLRVKDTTVALQELAAHVRRRQPLKVIGITGSAGKTTAKELTAAVVSQRYRTLKSEGNLNNTWGLPLQLLRLEPGHEAAVLEMGMSSHGEIARLAEIADPDVGVILNVLRVHLEHFKSLEDIARAKGELFRGLRRDAVAVYNADDRLTTRLGRAFKGPSLAYGVTSKGAEVRAEAIELLDPVGSRFVLRRGGDRAPVHLELPGRHNIDNALAAAAVGFALGLEAGTIRQGLESVRPVAMRGTLQRLPDGVLIIDDSYNSNPVAMERAIDMLCGARAQRRILVAGDMLELGPYGKRAHARLGEQAAAAGLDLFVAVGPLAAAAAETARRKGLRGSHHFPDSGAAAPFVAAQARPGDLLLVKGSRGMKMEKVVQAVLAAHGGVTAAGPDAGGDAAVQHGGGGR
jgi:UDP-N-acetylmuramoyl-tripeptide--D-alanyl-D-alanine ligase